MKVNPSALKHGVSEIDALYAAQNWVYASDPDDDMPAKQFVLGFDESGPRRPRTSTDRPRW